MKHAKSQNKVLIVVLMLITFVAISVTVWALFFRNSTPTLSPDYAPQEEEKYAQTIPDDSGEKLNQPEGGGSVSLTYSKEVSVNLGENTATLLFVNPGKSNQDMVVQIVVQDTVIVQSGTLKPSNQVKTLDLLDSAKGKLEEGVYDGKFNVLYYNQETGEKAIVNTEIPITVAVNK